MKSRMLLIAAIGLCLMRAELVLAQGPKRVRLVFDQAHGEQPPPDQLHAIAKKLGLEVQLLSGPVTTTALEGARILYLRAPSQEFAATEAEAIVTFVNGGGSLLLVLDEERRQSLEKTRVNSLISPFGMKLTPDSEYLHNTGAVAKAGEINKADREVPFKWRASGRGGHGVRLSARQRRQTFAPVRRLQTPRHRWPHRGPRRRDGVPVPR